MCLFNIVSLYLIDDGCQVKTLHLQGIQKELKVPTAGTWPPQHRRTSQAQFLPLKTSKVESDMEGESKMKRARHGGKKKNKDRLSNLPDCILIHILSLMDTKYAVQTCVLSKRWKDLWKHVPVLQLLSTQFRTVVLFRQFVSKVLTWRDYSTALCNLDFNRDGRVEPYFLRRLLHYAVSHNVQKLRMWISLKYDHELPSIIFSCQSLTSLMLCLYGTTLSFPKSLSLRNLTNLFLRNFEFCPSDDGRAEPFSGCLMLHTLILDCCFVKDSQILCIANATMANLVICECCKVDKIEISTPNLRWFTFTSLYPQKLIGGNFSFLEEIYVDVYWEHSLDSALILNNFLQVFTDVRSMILSPRTLEVLSLIPNLRNMPSSCFRNLNSLKVKTKRTFVPEIVKPNSSSPPTIPYDVIDYLLQNSPSAQVTILD